MSASHRKSKQGYARPGQVPCRPNIFNLHLLATPFGQVLTFAPILDAEELNSLDSDLAQRNNFRSRKLIFVYYSVRITIFLVGLLRLLMGSDPDMYEKCVFEFIFVNKNERVLLP